MKLAELRRAAVKRRLRIRFPLSNGMECVVNEHGIAQVPALRAIPSFNLEEELNRAPEFVVELAGDAKSKPRIYTAEELAQFAAPGVHEAAQAERED
jgi:hypothetical protein